MHAVVIFLHILVCIALILIVLLQKGKGADMGAAFGGSSQTVFGGAGATSFLTKLTTAAAIIFMITCLLLAFGFQKGKTSSSIMSTVKTTAPAAQQSSTPATQTAPAAQQSSAPAATQSTAPAGEQEKK
jgi:preprotein translocase subunit SecG